MSNNQMQHPSTHQQQQSTEVSESSFLNSKYKNEDSINLSKESTDNEQSEATTMTIPADDQIVSSLHLPQNDSERNEDELNHIKRFEEAFYKYYVDSSQNTNGNFDKYLSSGLKLISLMPQQNIQSEIERKAVLLPPRKHETNGNKLKKTLILDLDETLIHSDLDYQYKSHNEILKFHSDDKEEINLPIILRPGLTEFLNYASENFELVVFTASYQNYADAILNYIERERKYFTMRLYRDSCIFLSPGLYIKDLSIFINRRIEDILLIDNSIFSFANQLDNGVLVTSFFNDPEDTFLANLIDYLNYIIISSNDVRDVNRNSFCFEEYKLELIKQE